MHSAVNQVIHAHLLCVFYLLTYLLEQALEEAQEHRNGMPCVMAKGSCLGACNILLTVDRAHSCSVMCQV